MENVKVKDVKGGLVNVEEYGHLFPCTDSMMGAEYVPIGKKIDESFLMELLSFVLSNKDVRKEDVVVHDRVMYVTQFVLNEMGRGDLIPSE